MSPPLVFLVACAKHKCAAPNPPAMFGSLKPSEVKPLVTQWLAQTATLTPTFAASDLYRGASWAIYRDLIQQSPGASAYVVSAGFGLVSLAESRLPAYSATFASGEDSIADTIIASGGTQTRSAKHRQWWNALTQRQNSSCADLAGRHPQARFVVVGGSDYIEALRDDLACLRELCGSERLFILCAGYRATPGSLLLDCLVPATAQIEALLPGARSGLNARVLQWLVTQIVPRTGWNHHAIAIEIARALQSLVCSTQVKTVAVYRTRLCDHDVRDKLRQSGLKRSSSATQMLRYFRASGFACEEKRFRRIYDEEKIVQTVLTPSLLPDTIRAAP